MNFSKEFQEYSGNSLSAFGNLLDAIAQDLAIDRLSASRQMATFSTGFSIVVGLAKTGLTAKQEGWNAGVRSIGKDFSGALLGARFGKAAAGLARSAAVSLGPDTARLAALGSYTASSFGVIFAAERVISAAVENYYTNSLKTVPADSVSSAREPGSVARIKSYDATNALDVLSDDTMRREQVRDAYTRLSKKAAIERGQYDRGLPSTGAPVSFLVAAVRKWAVSLQASKVYVHVTTGSNIKGTDRLMKAAGAKFVGGAYVV